MSVETTVMEAVVAPPEGEALSYTPIEIDYTNIITEDDAPVDNLFSERQQRLHIASMMAAPAHAAVGDYPFTAPTRSPCMK